MRKIIVSSVYGLTAALAVSTVVGCVSGSSEYRETGTYVAPSTLRQIEPGETTGEWVHAVLGEPTERIETGKGQEIWKYHYSETRNRKGQIFFVIGSDSREAASSVYFEVKEGKVVKKWQG